MYPILQLPFHKTNSTCITTGHTGSHTQSVWNFDTQLGNLHNSYNKNSKEISELNYATDK